MLLATCLGLYRHARTGHNCLGTDDGNCIVTEMFGVGIVWNSVILAMIPPGQTKLFKNIVDLLMSLFCLIILLLLLYIALFCL